MISILYADDESVILRLCKQYPEGTWDLTVTTAEPTPSAQEPMQATSYNAIVYTYKMPDSAVWT